MFMRKGRIARKLRGWAFFCMALLLVAVVVIYVRTGWHATPSNELVAFSTLIILFAAMLLNSLRSDPTETPKEQQDDKPVNDAAAKDSKPD